MRIAVDHYGSYGFLLFRTESKTETLGETGFHRFAILLFSVEMEDQKSCPSLRVRGHRYWDGDRGY